MIYRAKIHPGSTRDFQVMQGVQWVALRCKHNSDRYDRRSRSLFKEDALWDEHPVRYVGGYSKLDPLRIQTEFRCQASRNLPEQRG